MEEVFKSIEVGETIATDQGELLRCVGKDENGEPFWELVHRS